MSHIVVVEDNELLSEMYQKSLMAEGYQVSVALDGATGLDLIEHVVPDLVLLDLMLPQMSGDEVLKKMRENDRMKDIKVVIMTNISESEAPVGLEKLKFERYIVKADATLSGVVQTVKETIGAATGAPAAAPDTSHSEIPLSEVPHPGQQPATSPAPTDSPDEIAL